MKFDLYRYRYNKQTQIGSHCYCPVCGKFFVKRKWNQIFDTKKCGAKYNAMKEGLYDDDIESEFDNEVELTESSSQDCRPLGWNIDTFDEYDEENHKHHYGYYNFITGEVLIDAQYDVAFMFHGGYAPVKKDGKWGVIDTNGNIVIDFKYQFMLDYNMDTQTLFVMLNNRCGIIDINDNIVVPIVYNKGYNFIDGFATMAYGEPGYNGKTYYKWRYLNTDGKEITSGWSAIEEWGKRLEGYGTVGKFVYVPELSKSVLEWYLVDKDGNVSPLPSDLE